MTTTDPTPAVEMKMQPEEFAELRAAVARVAQQDVHLGRVLELLVLHLGHAHGLDPTVEDARLAKKAREDARAAEDARLKDEADARARLRTAEDALPRTPSEQEALQARRAAEDAQLATDAEARTSAREEEDAREAKAPDNVASPAEAPAPFVEPTAPLEGAPA